MGNQGSSVKARGAVSVTGFGAFCIIRIACGCVKANRKRKGHTCQIRPRRAVSRAKGVLLLKRLSAAAAPCIREVGVRSVSLRQAGSFSPAMFPCRLAGNIARSMS